MSANFNDLDNFCRSSEINRRQNSLLYLIHDGKARVKDTSMRIRIARPIRIADVFSSITSVHGENNTVIL